MKGDFSKAAAITSANDLGLLYQQGRVISDRDLTAGELIAEAWREMAARDVIGAGVAAVPVADADGYRVEAAAVHGDHVDVRLAPGRIWADGISLTLAPAPGGGSAIVAATYLEPPANPPGTQVAGIDDGIRDAVILEVVLEALNGFQQTDRLIEPALGGPDTAERIHPNQRLRLLRLAAGEDCTTIGPRLADDLSAHGRLSVTLEPPTQIAGDCPVVEGGGYSGFEHNLYRIEIARTSGAAVMFKWSSLNGGLVGRGRFFGGADPRVEITANRTAILNSGITEYYLEALEFAPHLGHWRVVYGTVATLNADGDIDLAAPATFGTLPGAGGTVFFRLWNGIAPIAGFAGAPTPFRDGIELQFPSAAAAYRPEDFWTFDLRAGEIENPETLHDNAPPQGPRLHRVPLAEITWTDRANTEIGGEIEDCRRRFRPLTNQKICCTYLVGNGVTSFGDFDRLEEAVAHLPPSGGQVCLLPGIHLANLHLVNRTNVKIHGCRERTLVLPRMKAFADPVIRIDGGAEIEIADLDFFAPFDIAIDAKGTEKAPLRGLRIRGCRVLALVYGLRLHELQNATVQDNRIWMIDHVLARSAISIRATDSRIVENVLGVWPFEFSLPGSEKDPDEELPDPADPCIEPEDLYGNLVAVIAHVHMVWLTAIVAPPEQPYRALGGLHLRGSCARIDVVGNRIDGGVSHGIVLGGTYPAEVKAQPAPDKGHLPVGATIKLPKNQIPGLVEDEAGAPVIGLLLSLRTSAGVQVQSRLSGPPDGRFVFDSPGGTFRLVVTPGYQVVSAKLVANETLQVVVRRVEADLTPDSGFLTQIRIIDNTVERMGLSGIGFLFHSLTPTAPLLPAEATIAALTEFLAEVIAPRELIGTTNLIRDLEIRGNRIQDNLRNVFTELMRALATKIAQGGISLPLVEGARITDNHIVRNGLTAANPCAGVFIGYGEEVILSGNYISGNGPLAEDFDSAGIEGLRGGVVIRMATAMISGGAADARERPALDLRDNHIDQPAGRALTAFAFGPVSCVGNHLNSEREGRWSFVDRFAGAVLVANLGGLHRHFAPAGNTGFGFGKITEGKGHEIGLGAMASVEALLPGGEVMFNSNRVRTGGDNRAYASQLILTFDDLGYDGNQSAMFKPEEVFTNLAAVGMTVRVTDNRLRERARSTAMSTLALSFGLGLAGRAYAMNATVHNQADHCIIAASNGPPLGQPVLDLPNLVVFGKACPVEGKQKRDYLMRALQFLLQIESQPEIDLAEAGQLMPDAAGKLVGKVGEFQDHLLAPKAQEVMRAERAFGGQDATAFTLRSEMFRRHRAAGAMVEQGLLAAVREAAEPKEGALVVDGRVTDAKGNAVAGAEVEIVDARGRGLDIAAKTDAAGYYALAMTADQKEKLGKIEGVAVRASFGNDTPALLPATVLLRDGQGKVRADIVTDRLKDFRFDPPLWGKLAGKGDVVIRPVGPVQPEDPVKPDDPVRPDDPVKPAGPIGPEPGGGAVARVPLGSVRGIGPAVAERLRAEGIADANALAVFPLDKLRDILGQRADTIREAALDALREAGVRPDGG